VPHPRSPSFAIAADQTNANENAEETSDCSGSRNVDKADKLSPLIWLGFSDPKHMLGLMESKACATKWKASTP